MSDPTADLVAAGLTRTFGHGMSEASSIDVLRNGDEIFPAMLGAIDSATESIDFATFVYWQGDIARQFAAALADRARAGVRVRVLIDAYGGKPMAGEVRATMLEAGCRLADYNPVDWRRPWRAGHRTHRKVLIVDDRVAFTGGVGIASEWTGDANDPSEWRDTHMRFTGTVVNDLRSTFVDNWLDSTTDHPLDLVGGPPPAIDRDGASTVSTFVVAAGYSDRRNRIHDHFRLLIGSAQSAIRLTTAYFVPDEYLCADLVDAVERGVDVQLLLPGPHTDKNFVRLAARDIITNLRDQGVEIHMYQPTMLHAKVLTIDGVVATIGSANLNRRSAHHDQEANVVIFDEATVATLDRHFLDDVEQSIPPTRDPLTTRDRLDALAEGALRRLRPWM